MLDLEKHISSASPSENIDLSEQLAMLSDKLVNTSNQKMDNICKIEKNTVAASHPIGVRRHRGVGRRIGAKIHIRGYTGLVRYIRASHPIGAVTL